MKAFASLPEPFTTLNRRSSDAPDSVGGKERFFLSKDAHVCRLRRHWVILDVRADQYYCIPAQEFDSLGSLVHGWKSVMPEIPAVRERSGDDTRGILNQFVLKGVLTESARSGKALAPSGLGLPTAALGTAESESMRGSWALLFVTFLIACITADRRLRKHPFALIVKAVKDRRAGQSCPPSVIDQSKLRNLVAAFNGFRLWYPRPYLCLFDSLALLEFLAWYRIYPCWIFGVAADPFLAHCWLQDGPTVINDVLSRVSAYSPLMSV